jgi:hypothetical protein
VDEGLFLPDFKEMLISRLWIAGVEKSQEFLQLDCSMIAREQHFEEHPPQSHDT